MSGTALYRALVHAGAPEEEAKEAASVIDDELKSMRSDINELKVMVTEMRALTRLNSAMILVILAFILKLSFG